VVEEQWEDWSPVSIRLLANLLSPAGIGDVEAQRDVLERAHLLHPDDHHLLGHLASTYGNHRPTDFAKAIRYYTAAIAARPDSAKYWMSRGAYRRVTGDLDGAIADARRALRIRPLPSIWSNLGNALHLKGEDVEAEKAYREAIRLDPDRATWRVSLGYLLESRGMEREALAAYRKALEMNPGEPFALLNLAGLLVRMGNETEALEHLETLVEVTPRWSRAHYTLGNILRIAGARERALAAYRDALANDPESCIYWRGNGRPGSTNVLRAAIHNDRGTILQDLNRNDEAIREFEMALEADPRHGYAYNNLGGVYLATGQIEEAIETFRKAIEAVPEYGTAHYNLGRILAGTGRTEEALPHLRKGARLAKEGLRFDAWLDLGAVLYDGAQEYAEALEAFRECVKLKPDHAWARYCLGNALGATGDTDGAIAEYEKALELDSSPVEIWVNLGGTLKERGDLKRAAEKLEEARRRHPEHPMVLNALAGLRLADDPAYRDLEKGLELARKAVELATGEGALYREKVLTTLGRALLLLGEHPEAREKLEEALALTKNEHGRAHDRLLLALAHHRCGDPKKAREAYDAAVAWMTAKPRPPMPTLERLRREAQEALGVDSR
jgi:tetratricopeptide (TPR) repeat protein